MAISKTQPMRTAEIQLVDEVNAHANSISRLDGSVAALTESLGDEIEDREQADTQLQNNISNEALQRYVEDTALSGRINTEVQTRADADTALGARIDGTNAIIPASAFTSTNTVKKYVDDETTARTNADTALGARIDGTNAIIPASAFTSTNTVKKYVDDETTARTNADTALSGRIDAETQNRTDADAALQTQMGNGFSTTSVTDSLAATNQQVLGLTNDVDMLENTTLPNLEQRVTTIEGEDSHYKRGISSQITVPAISAVTNSVVFATPFPQGAQCGVFPILIPAALSTLCEITITTCNSSGFSFQIDNNDTQNSHDVYVGFVAVSF